MQKSAKAVDVPAVSATKSFETHTPAFAAPPVSFLGTMKLYKIASAYPGFLFFATQSRTGASLTL